MLRSLALLDELEKERKLGAGDANVRAYWNVVGKQEPWWGVLTQPAYKGKLRLTPESEDEFFASGAEVVAFMDEQLRNHAETSLSALAHSDSQDDPIAFLELGCGVGRIAAHVAKHCHIVCVDIAESYLSLLSETLERRGITNFTSARSLDEVPPSLSFRFAYSFLTLQHNPPGVILALTARLCGLLALGGFAMLHVPYYIPDHVLMDYADVMQMNFVTRDALLQSVKASGCRVLATLDNVDFCGGEVHNCVYLIHKNALIENQGPTIHNAK